MEERAGDVSFRSTASFFAAIKKNIVDTAPTTIIIDMAHRRDSLPRDGASWSLIIPTTNGPNPRPIRFNTKNKIAEVSDRIDAGTRLCATAMDGPRYMLCREAQQPKQINEKDVF